MAVEPTEAEKRNGWHDPAALAAYLEDRDRRASQIIMASMNRKPRGPLIENCKSFDPHKWVATR